MRRAPVDVDSPIVNHGSIHRIAIDSSAIDSVGYDEQSQILEIEFKGGEVYCYLDVPASVFHDLMNADSKGRIFHSQIRNHGYRFQRVN